MPSLLRPLMPAVAIVASLAATAPASPQGRLIVAGGDRPLGESVATVPLDASTPRGAFLAVHDQAGTKLPAVIVDDPTLPDGRPRLSIVLGSVVPGQATEYRLKPAGREADGMRTATVAIDGNSRNLAIRIGDDPFATLVQDDPKAAKPYLFPLIGPTGKRFTRAYPMADVEGEPRDHPHQRSFWFTHGKVNGIDFWMEEPGHGWIRPRTTQVLASGTAAVIVATENDWMTPDESKRVASDRRVIRFYATQQARAIDFDIVLTASDGPLTFGDTKEGMFGLRVASSLDVKRKQGGRIVNAEGLTDLDAWGKPSPWVDYSGAIDGEPAGVAILNHPESFRYPTTWHVRDYGLFAANPFGWHDFGKGESGDHTVAAGDSIRFRYRVILHRGDVSAADVAGAFRAYAEPPAIRFVAD